MGITICYAARMRVIAKATLLRFIARQPKAGPPVLAWWRAAEAANWTCMQDLKAYAGSVSIIDAERAVFNLGGNKYRLVVALAWKRHLVFIKFIGTHADYDRINAATVEPE